MNTTLLLLFREKKPVTRFFTFCTFVFLLTAFNSSSYAQDLNTYSFQVENVNDYGAAKEMTDYIRPLFNTAEQPFGYFPYYDEAGKRFHFQSTVVVSEDELRMVLEQQALVLINFKMGEDVPTINTVKQ